MSDLTEWELRRAGMAFQMGNLSGLIDALWICQDEGLPLPEWVHQALAETLREHALESKSGARWVRRWKQDLVDWDRHALVQTGREARELWEADLAALKSQGYEGPAVAELSKRLRETLSKLTEPL